MVNVNILKNIAIAGAPIAIGGGFYFTYKVQSNFRKQEFYSKSLEILHGYEPGVEKIGQPIQVKKLDLGNKAHNYTDGLYARIAIPLKGEKEKATLHTWASRSKAGDSWQINKADLEMKQMQWTFFLHPAAQEACSLTQDMTTEQYKQWEDDRIHMIREKHKNKYKETHKETLKSENQPSELSYLDTKWK